jgi:chorismate dehydratase
MKKIKISAVSFLNTLPFVYGINNSDYLDNQIELSLDIPSICADKLINNQVDISLIPTAELIRLGKYYLISDYCIGAIKSVKSVLLVCQVPYSEIDSILLDYHSRTSIKLVQILSSLHWKIKPDLLNTTPGYEKEIKGNIAGVIIGDRALELSGNYKYIYDLAEEWYNFSNLPFVFACWVANKEIDKEFLINFNKTLKSGLNNIDFISKKYSEVYKNIDLKDYFVNCISYDLDSKKKEGMKLFLEYCTAL